MKKIIINFLLIMGAFLGGEIYLHASRPSLVEFDKELGWKLKKNFDRVFPQSTQAGIKYNAHFQTNEFGFRTYGENLPESKKILVLGDSFTGDSFTSNDKAWFSVLAKTIEINEHLLPGSITVWAGGAGGYGTLQELILSKRIKEKFKPDMLILQFCSNDFYDNHLEWQSHTILRQLYLRRPYANTNGEILFSQSFLAPLYRSYLFQNSRILNKIDSLINSLEFMYHNGYSPRIDSALEEEYAEESIKITQMLLKQMSEEFPKIPKIMVNCSMDQSKLNTSWTEQAKNAKFTPIFEPSNQVQSGLKNGEDLLHADRGHWNEEGNKVFGSSIAKRMQILGLESYLLPAKK